MIRLILIAIILSVAAPGTAQYSIETVAEGLEYPWSLAFLPNGSMLVTERSGRLRLIHDGELVDAPIANVPSVYVAGQGGLFDVVLDPEFGENQTIYLSYATGNRRKNATRVARARLEGLALNNFEVILTVAPSKSTPHHYGGRMVFLTDKTLLVTTGDGFNYREHAQRLDSLLGKVIRINRDGSVPRDNPFVDQGKIRPEIWSYGHRNPQAIIQDGDTGVVFLHEHGPRGGDELNRIEAGLNYGWPGTSYGIDYTGALVTPYSQYAGVEDPLVYWVPSIAPAGMSYYGATLFPDWRGDLFVAALAEKSVRRLDMQNGQVIDQEILFEELGERMRDVRVGPDGALYILTDSADGKVLRVTPDDQ